MNYLIQRGHYDFIFWYFHACLNLLIDVCSFQCALIFLLPAEILYNAGVLTKISVSRMSFILILR